MLTVICAVVMRGLDPRIHLPSQNGVLRRRWVAGSSPATTPESDDDAAGAHQARVTAVSEPK
jgi:hypothetical protein